jgi:hypothetical protein
MVKFNPLQVFKNTFCGSNFGKTIKINCFYNVSTIFLQLRCIYIGEA